MMFLNIIGLQKNILGLKHDGFQYCVAKTNIGRIGSRHVELEFCWCFVMWVVLLFVAAGIHLGAELL